ncbi:MAG: GNAT family N-acetyltransferase [Intrasporangium sp.]|uniref:GNAT family N-acetyltransferase n=1 Tax=Intrasporangium sp. TaxID=1925024 RepID=UPI003F812065
MTPSALETDRLTLRGWSHDEAPRLLDMLGRKDVTQWLGDGEPWIMADLEEAHRTIDRYAERSATPPIGIWAVEVRDTGQVAGSVMLLPLPRSEAGEVEIAWHLHPDSWGRGYATEAALALLEYGFRSGLSEVLAVTHVGNDASARVCGRLGMRDEGVVRKWYDVDMQLYRITGQEWARRSAR